MSPYERDPYAFEIIGDSPDLDAFGQDGTPEELTDDDEEASRRRRLIGVAFVALAVLIAGVGGFLAGSQWQRPATAVSASAADLAAGSSGGGGQAFNPLAIVDHCTTAAGARLALGVEFRNTGTTSITLQKVALGEALPGKQGIGAWSGTCGQTQNLKLPDDVRLAPGEKLWISSTIDARLPCDWPQLLPLAFTYWTDGQTVSAQVNPFTDLADGSYPKCTL